MLWRPLVTGRAEPNATRMILGLVASQKCLTDPVRSIKVVLGALNDSFEVGAFEQSNTAHKPSPVPVSWFALWLRAVILYAL